MSDFTDELDKYNTQPIFPAPVTAGQPVAKQSPEDMVKAINAKYPEPAPVPTPAPEEGVLSELGKRAVRGFSSIPAMVPKILGGIASTVDKVGLGNPGDVENMKNLANKMTAYKDFVPSVQSYDQVKDIPSAVKFIGGGLAEGVPSVLPVLAAGAIGGPVGVSAAMGAQTFGDIAQTQIEKTGTVDLARLLPATAIGAALGNLGIGRTLARSGLLGSALKEAPQLLEQFGVLKKMGMSAAEMAAINPAFDILNSLAVEGTPLPGAKELLNSAIHGGIFGAALAGGTHVLERKALPVPESVTGGTKNILEPNEVLPSYPSSSINPYGPGPARLALPEPRRTINLLTGEMEVPKQLPGEERLQLPAGQGFTMPTDLPYPPVKFREDIVPMGEARTRSQGSVENLADPIKITDPQAYAEGQLSPIDKAAHQAATSPLNNLPEPTQAQKEAGNTQKGHVRIQGLDISVENPAGSTRSGINEAGKPWEQTMENHYGYIKGTIGKDKDHIDSFIGPNPESKKVFVVNQRDAKGDFNEHKVMIGFDTLEEAQQAYHANYEPGWQGMKSIVPMTMDTFKEWTKKGDTKSEVGPVIKSLDDLKLNLGPDAPDMRQLGERQVVFKDPQKADKAFFQDKGILYNDTQEGWAVANRRLPELLPDLKKYFVPDETGAYVKEMPGLVPNANQLQIDKSQKEFDRFLRIADKQNETVPVAVRDYVQKNYPELSSKYEELLSKVEPKEAVSESDFKSIAKDLSIRFDGMQEQSKGEPLSTFTDPITKSTFMVERGGDIAGELAKVREKFGVKGKDTTSTQLRKNQLSMFPGIRAALKSTSTLSGTIGDNQEGVHYGPKEFKVLRGARNESEASSYSKEIKQRMRQSTEYVEPPTAIPGYSKSDLKKLGRYNGEVNATATPDIKSPGESWYKGGAIPHNIDISGYYDGNKDIKGFMKETNKIVEANPQLHYRNVFANMIQQAGYPGYVMNVGEKTGERWAFGFGSIPVLQDVRGKAAIAAAVKNIPFNPAPAGVTENSSPGRTYKEASDTKAFNTHNTWIRQSADQDNSGRQLLMQFSTHLINKTDVNAVKDSATKYYDALYSGERPGYTRLHDFWEIPQWMGFASHFLPNADVYVVQDMAEAKKFLKGAGYERVMFSAIDVNTPFIKELANALPDTHFDVGGYTKDGVFDGIKNLNWYKDMKAFAEDNGFQYSEGTDYRHFAGSSVIPRLTMSQGCLHKCAFCVVEKKLVETPLDVIMQQAESFKVLDSGLVYLNDKTFGQAKNYTHLTEVNDILKQNNPGFKGFIIQTTAASVNKMSPEFLKESGIKYVEIGVESYNDFILKELHKPHNEALIDKAMEKLRENDIQAIPNIIVGLQAETAETYARTQDFLERNKDIISHANIYNLAIYKDSELGKKITADDANDIDENQISKSFHVDKKIHKDFSESVYSFGQNQLTGSLKDSGAAVAKETPTQARMVKQEVAAAIKPITDKITGNKNVNVIEKSELSTLSPEVQKYVNDRAAEGKEVQGVYDPKTKTIHLFSDTFDTPEEAQRILLHEMNHYGLDGILGDRYDATMERILKGAMDPNSWTSHQDLIDQLVKDYGTPEHPIDLTNATDRLKIAEEYVSKLAETNQKPGVLNKIYAQMRSALRAMGFDLKFTNNDLRDLISRAHNYAQTGGVDGILKEGSGLPNIKGQPMFALKSVNPEVDEAWAGARGLKDKTAWEKVKDHLTDIRSNIEHFKHYESSWKGAEETLRTYENVSNYAANKAATFMNGIVKILKSKENQDLFERVVILRDLVSEASAGKLAKTFAETGELPFKYHNVEEMKADLANFEKMAAANPQVTKAIDARNEFFNELRADMVKHGVLPEDILGNEDYFHHQVHIYANMENYGSGLVSKDVRKSKQPWQRSRTGYAGDYNTNYFEAESKVMMSMVNQVETAKTHLKLASDFQPVFDHVLDETRREAQALGVNETKYIKENLKKNIEKYAPGSVAWQPERGNFMYETLSLTERNMKKVMDHLGDVRSFETEMNMSNVLDLLDRFPNYNNEDLFVKRLSNLLNPQMGVSARDIVNFMKANPNAKRVLAIGEAKPFIIIPKSLATQLDTFRAMPESNAFAKLAYETQKRWKQWQLFNPARVVKYSFNNATGDADVVFAYRPNIIKNYAKQAAIDSFRFVYNKEMTQNLKEEFDFMVKKDIVGGGMTTHEIPDLKGDVWLKMFKNPNENIVTKYFGTMARFNNFRENILRIASFRYMRDEIAAGREDGLNFAASKADRIKAIPDPIDRAARMSRDLVGDYGNISYLGKSLGRYIVPFYTWMEINAPRYVRLMKNEIQSSTKSGVSTRTAGVAGWSAAKLGLRMATYYALVNVWNHVMFPGEDDEMRRLGRDQLHLILGRNGDGSVRSIRIQGAFSDAMSWFGLENLPQDAEDLVSGHKSWSKFFQETYQAPINRAVQGAVPVYRGIGEAAAGKSMYPDVFNPRPVRDKVQQLAKSFGMDYITNKIQQKPGEPWYQAFPQILFYKTDTGEAAYFYSMKKAFDWMEENNLEKPISEPTKRSNALYYYKQAIKYGEQDLADAYLKEFKELGGKQTSIKQSVQHANPLSVIPTAKRSKFLMSLDPDDKQAWTSAIKWWRETYVQHHNVNQDTIPGRALGGPVTEDKRYIVGEEGPELFMPNKKASPRIVGQSGQEQFIPPQSGTILPNTLLTKGMSNNIGGFTEPSLINKTSMSFGGGQAPGGFTEPGLIDSLDKRKMAQWQKEHNPLPKVTVTRNDEFNDSFLPRQQGGPVTEGEKYVVGEAGPELYVPNNNTSPGTVLRDGVQIPIATSQEQSAFNAWLQKNGDRDPYHPEQHYDLVGAFRAGINRTDERGNSSPIRRDPVTGQATGGHLPDTFKLPGHPTFSNQSQYYKPGMKAGRWENNQYISIPKGQIIPQ